MLSETLLRFQLLARNSAWFVPSASGAVYLGLSDSCANAEQRQQAITRAGADRSDQAAGQAGERAGGRGRERVFISRGSVGARRPESGLGHFGFSQSVFSLDC